MALIIRFRNVLIRAEINRFVGRGIIKKKTGRRLGRPRGWDWSKAGPELLTQIPWAARQRKWALYPLVQQKGTKFTQVLGSDGGLGTLVRVTVLKRITNGHYDRVTWMTAKHIQFINGMVRGTQLIKRALPSPVAAATDAVRKSTR